MKRKIGKYENGKEIIFDKEGSTGSVNSKMSVNRGKPVDLYVSNEKTRLTKKMLPLLQKCNTFSSY